MTFEEKLQSVEWGRLHYSSSPDRGLDNILYMLPWIIEKCPDIKLHMFYGFFNWKSAAQARNSIDELKKIEEMEKAIESMKDHVVMHDRVSQPELAKEWKKAWLWLYPTQFTETYCITANEAMLSYTPIMCSHVAALETTVGQWGIRVDEYSYSKEAREKYIAETVKLYHDKNHWEWWAKRSHQGAQSLSWDDRHKDHWSKLLL